MRALLLFLAVRLFLDSSVRPAVAQDFLDRGTFVIVQNGIEIGREEFAIRPTVDRRGQNGVLSVSTVRFRDREVQHALELSADQVPQSFQEPSTQGGRVVVRYSAQLSGVRFSARLASHDGETAREFPVRLPLAVLGSDAYNEFYFVPRPTIGTTRTVSVIRPSDERAVAGTVEGQGADTVLVGDRRLAANRFVLRLPDGDERRFWITANGDLLRIAVPRLSIVATRSELPAH